MKKIVTILAIMSVLMLMACAPAPKEEPPKEVAEPDLPEDLEKGLAETSEIDQDLAAIDDLDADLAELEDLI